MLSSFPEYPSTTTEINPPQWAKQEKNTIPCSKSNNEINNPFSNFTSEGEIYSIAYNNNNSTWIIGDGEDTTYLYNTHAKQLISKAKHNKESINHLLFSYNNDYLLSTSNDGVVSLFNPNDNYSLIAQISDQDSEITWVIWHPKGSWFAFGTIEGAVWVYLANNLESNMNFFSHNNATTCGWFTWSGHELISCGQDGLCKVYDLKKKKVKMTISSEIGPISCLDINSDITKTIIVCGSLNNEIQFVNYENGKILYFWDCNTLNPDNNTTEINDEEEEVLIPSIENINFCNWNKYVVFSNSECGLNIFDISSMEIRSKISLENENWTKIMPSRTNNWVIFASGTDGNFYVIDTRGSCEIVKKLKMHCDVIMDFVVIDDERKVITSSLDKRINEGRIY